MRKTVPCRLLRAFAPLGVLALSILVASPASAAAWVTQSPDTGVTLTSVAFANDSYGVAVGASNRFFVTTNSGKNWTQTSYVAPNSVIFDVATTSGGVAYAVGASGAISKGTNSTTWTTLLADTTATLRGVDCVSDTVCWAVGSGGVILKTTNGGSNWAFQSSGVSNDLIDVDFVDSNVGWIVGRSGRVLKTTNGGTSWTIQSSGIETDIASVAAIDSNTAWFAGTGRVLRKTANGGSTWSAVSLDAVAAGTNLNRVVFRNSSEGYVVGDSGAIASTSNGGTNWGAMSSGTTNSLRGLAYSSAGYLWAVGDFGTVRVYDAVGPTAPGSPTVNPISPTNDNTPTFTWTASTDAIGSISAYGVKIDSGFYTAVGNVLTYTPAAVADGAHTFYVEALDSAGNYSAEATLAFTVDTGAPSVPAPTPTAATVNKSVTISVTPSDAVTRAASCDLYISGGKVGAMTWDSGNSKFVYNHTFTSVGTYSVYATCTDQAGNVGTGQAASVVVSASGDTTVPTVTNVSPTAATQNVSTAFSGTVYDNVGVVSCDLYVNSVDQGAMTISGGVASRNYTFTSTGTQVVKIACLDAAANLGYTSWNVTVSAPGTDTTAPTVTNVSPSSATLNSATTVTASVSDNVGVVSCDLYVNNVSQGAMSVSGGTASRSHTFTATGDWTVKVSCADAAANVGYGTVTTTVSVGSQNDTTAPTVTSLSPSNATVNSATTVSASVSDNVGISSCNLYVNNVDQGTMTVSGGVASRSYTFTSTGTQTVKVACTDAAANVGLSTLAVSVSAASADTTAPTVTSLSPSSAVVNSQITVYATVSDNVSVSSCSLYVNNVYQGAMTVSGGTASRSYTFVSAGNQTVKVACSDAAANVGFALLTTAVSGGSSDGSSPSVGTPWPNVARAGTAISIYSSVSDDVGVSSCNLYVDGIDRGSMDISGGIASKTYTFSSTGSYNVFVACKDAAGNQGIGQTTSVSVLSATVDSTTPSAANSSVSAYPSSVVADDSSTSIVTVTVRNSNGVALSGKTVTLSTSRYAYDTIRVVSLVTNDLGQATFSIKSSSSGSSVVTAVSDGLTVGSASVTWTAASTSVGPGSLIKYACPAVVPVNHPCTAVYYYGTDGKRHAFPNEKVYGTWFTGFGSVKMVSESFIASLPLGTNVTYRPGITLIKFQSLNTVYAISKGGVLRAIANEAVARALYGDGWASKVNDLSEVFFTNYRYGSDITDTSGYRPSDETASANSIDANF